MPKGVWSNLTGLPKFKELVTVGWGQHKFDERNRRAVFTKGSLPTGARVGKRFARFAPSSSIRCHAVDWQDWYVDTDLFSRERKSQFTKPKLVFSASAPLLRAAFDEQGLFLGHTLFSTAARAPMTYTYLTGVLNSVLGNFLFAMTNELSDFSKPRPLQAEHLAGIPLAPPADEPGRKLFSFIESNVLRLIHAKQARRVVTNVWTHVANYHAQGYGTVTQLLTNHLPGQKSAWVKRLVPSLATLNRRSRKFSGVRLQGDKDGPVLRLYGHTDAGEELVLAEAEFSDRDLMLYASLSASTAPRPKNKPSTVRQIMEEARVPLPGENVTDGAHLVIAQLKTKAPKALQGEGIPAARTDIATLDYEIDELEALVDAEVFRVYGLSAEQVATIMKWCRTTGLQRQRIETFLDHITRSPDEALPFEKPPTAQS